MSQKKATPSLGFRKRNNNSRGGQSQSQGGGKSETPRANIYTGNTIRTEEQKRKTVFKAVLNSPFNISWPNVSLKDRSEILDALCEILIVMKRPTNKGTSKKMKPDNDPGKIVKIEMDIDILMSRKQPPPICSNVYFGINEVTKHLEQMASSQVHSSLNHNLLSANPNDQLSSIPLISQAHHSSLEMVFVCKADLLPQLYSHLPTMCSIAGDVLLVPLPSGASKRISDIVSFKRVSCVGIKKNAPEFMKICKMVKEKVKPVNASWLNPLKSPENLSNKRKITKEEEMKQEMVEEYTYSNTFKRKQVEMTHNVEPNIKVEVSSSSSQSPSIYLFGQQPQIKIEYTSTQSKPTGFDYIPTQIKQLVTTAPANKDQAKEKRQEKKLKHKQRVKREIHNIKSGNEDI